MAHRDHRIRTGGSLPDRIKCPYERCLGRPVKIHQGNSLSDNIHPRRHVLSVEGFASHQDISQLRQDILAALALINLFCDHPKQGRYAMDKGDTGLFHPLDESFHVCSGLFFRNAEHPSGDQGNEDVPQACIKGDRRQLSDPDPFIKPEFLDFPVNEMAKAFITALNRFRNSGRTGGIYDIGTVIGIGKRFSAVSFGQSDTVFEENIR